MPRRPPLTDAQVQALITCWHARVLTCSHGRYYGSYLNPPVAPPVVSDLARDGLLMIDRDRSRKKYNNRAYLTAKGAMIAERFAKEAEAFDGPGQLKQAAE